MLKQLGAVLHLSSSVHPATQSMFTIADIALALVQSWNQVVMASKCKYSLNLVYCDPGLNTYILDSLSVQSRI